MKVRVDRKAFTEALAIVGAALPARPQAAILSAIELRAEGDHLRLRATDWEQVIWQSVEAEIGDEGVAHVSGHRLRSLVSAFSASDVDLLLDGSMLNVSSGTSRFRTPTMRESDFPSAPEIPARTGSVEASDLAAGLRRIAHAKGGDPATDVYGITLTGEQHSMWLLSTDLYVVGGTEVDYSGTDFHIRLPYEHALAAVKVANGPIDIHVGESNIAFVSGDSGMMTRLVDPTKYPALRDFAARVSGETFTVDRVDLMQALARTELVLDRNGSVQVDIADGVASLSSREEGSDLVESVEVVSIADHRALVNPTYLRAALDCIQQERVEFTMPPLNKAGAIGLVGVDGGYRSPDIHIVQSKRPL